MGPPPELRLKNRSEPCLKERCLESNEDFCPRFVSIETAESLGYKEYLSAVTLNLRKVNDYSPICPFSDNTLLLNGKKSRRDHLVKTGSL